MKKSQNENKPSKFVLRLPSSLCDHYRELASKHNRSINQEMVNALESYAERMETLDILIMANREMLLRNSGKSMREEFSNVVPLVSAQEN